LAYDIRELSTKTVILLFALIFCSLAGNTIGFAAFGLATERINKKIRDKAFRALMRQEVAWFDVRSGAQITSQLLDDAAMIHSFSGEPIRSFMTVLSSVGVGIIVSFYFMWEVRYPVD
jgi:ATP-binding cassette subfamily B (MDR/TAP) protein 1